MDDKTDIQNDRLLNDRVVDAAQQIIKEQFPDINGFQPTVFKQNLKHFKMSHDNTVPTLHRGDRNQDTVSCKEGSVNWYDSMYTELDIDRKLQVCSILKYDGKPIKFNKVPVQTQQGAVGCGFNDIAFATAICNGNSPQKLVFNQEQMRQHLIESIENKNFTNFSFSVNTKWRKTRIVSTKENLFCICRSIYDSTMVQRLACQL